MTDPNSRLATAPQEADVPVSSHSPFALLGIVRSKLQDSHRDNAVHETHSSFNKDRFRDQRHMTRVFVKHEGCPPPLWRHISRN